MAVSGLETSQVESESGHKSVVNIYQVRIFVLNKIVCKKKKTSSCSSLYAKLKL